MTDLVKLPGNEERWQGSMTLGETIVKMVQEKLTGTPEFKAILEYYGRERVKKIYKDELERVKVP